MKTWCFLLLTTSFLNDLHCYDAQQQVFRVTLPAEYNHLLRVDGVLLSCKLLCHSQFLSPITIPFSSSHSPVSSSLPHFATGGLMIQFVCSSDTIGSWNSIHLYINHSDMYFYVGKTLGLSFTFRSIQRAVFKSIWERKVISFSLHNKIPWTWRDGSL